MSTVATEEVKEGAGPISVKEAVKAVRVFIGDLFGADQLRYATLEEVELNPAGSEWLVTMSLGSPGAAIFNPDEKDYKTFRVNAQTGQVASMKFRK